MDDSTNEETRRPPFPMPFTHSTVEPSSCPDQQRFGTVSSCSLTGSLFPTTGCEANADNTPRQADYLCQGISNEMLCWWLVSLVGLDNETAKQFLPWIENDIRYFISRNFDFGLAYATACVGWKYFKEEGITVGEEDAFVARQSGLWLRKQKEVGEARTRAISTGGTGQGLINEPHVVMPRRICDLKRNRVVEYQSWHPCVQSSLDLIYQRDWHYVLSGP